VVSIVTALNGAIIRRPAMIWAAVPPWNDGSGPQARASAAEAVSTGLALTADPAVMLAAGLS
jgi:hypothetical protein